MGTATGFCGRMHCLKAVAHQAAFIAAPWTTLPGGPTASVAGAYDPADASSEFTTTALNLAWYDIGNSNDGPAARVSWTIDCDWFA